MGILDSILSPIRHVISGLESPVHAVEEVLSDAEHVFGEVISFTEDLIREFRSMITDLESLFHASKVEKLFLSPFKEAAFLAVGSIEKLFDLMVEVSDISADGVKDLIMDPVKDAYGFMKKSLEFFKDEMKNMIDDIEDAAAALKRGLLHEFKRIESVIELLPTELKIISRRIKEEFEVSIQKAGGEIFEFGEFAEREVKTAAGKVTKRGEATRDTFESIEKSVKNRLAAESAQVDFVAFAVIGLLLALVAGIFMVTQSWIVVKIVALFIVMFFVVFVVVGFIRSLVF